MQQKSVPSWKDLLVCLLVLIAFFAWLVTPSCDPEDPAGPCYHEYFQFSWSELIVVFVILPFITIRIGCLVEERSKNP